MDRNYNEHTIELKKVSKYYAGEESISMGFARVDLNLDMGEFVAITGESGSGKSTLLNIISGLDNYDEGEMFVCGEDTTAYTTEDYERYRKTYIGNIFQDFNLINSYNVYQNIELVMLLCGKKRRECKARIKELIKLVGLTEYTHTKASKLSGGQKQRVAIARALAKDAPIIVADEPTGNLDSESAAIVMETLAKVSENKLIVIVTHNYEQAEPYVTRKLTMHDGRIIEDKKQAAPAREALIAGERGYESYDLDEIMSGVNFAEQADNADDAVFSVAEQTGKAGDAVFSVGEQTGKTGDAVFSVGGQEAVPKRVSRVERNAEAAASAAKPAKAQSAKKPISAGFKNMGFWAELRLGIRNTFNLPAKFILLFIVYLFVATSVLSQYASTKSSSHQSDLLGYNDYFMNTEPNRIIVTKEDATAFTDEDIAYLEGLENTEEIVKNDLAIDKPGSIRIKGMFLEGPLYPIGDIKEEDLTYGRMPENEREIVVKLDSNCDAYQTVQEKLDGVLDASVHICDYYDYEAKLTQKKVKIVGLILEEAEQNENLSFIWGLGKIYVSDEVNNETLVAMMAGSAKTVFNFDGAKISNDYRVIYPSDKVGKGKVYINEYQKSYYKEGKALGKKFSIKASTKYFDSSVNLKVDKVVTEKNIHELLGINKAYYDNYSSAVFISRKDYKKLFDQGNFQVSLFMKNEVRSEDTMKELQSHGYKTLLLKDTLTDITGGFDFVLQLITSGRLIIEFLILFFIAYAVIKLIMKSRNTYYSTIRILGGTKKNTDRILRIELIIMMLIAYLVDIAAVMAVKLGYINVEEITNLLSFLEIRDYGILAAILLFMSVLIANRYSRKIFTKSAMKTYREEVQ